jgi:hypothetical protein
MKSKTILIVAVSIAVLAASAVYVASVPQEKILLDFSAYLDENKTLKERLANSGILMSSPLKFGDPNSIKKYCTLFADEQRQKLVKYCTSTELTDETGEFIGNIHMVGSSSVPELTLVLIQTNYEMSTLNVVYDTFDAVIESSVCQCWEEVSPDGFTSTRDWIDGLKQFHFSDIKQHSKSKQIVLEGKVVQLELTTNKDGNLWQLYVYS